ncbi:helix-turn-helix domain containing protein [Nocardiopsis sp. RSe5-2]|uniref:Helix-turn-helix domain containing protein n=1 Tax=Nocardiopsis endophytica TaxID=3018445 RepID=A0ABT4TYL0_9ACTN|nr:helix-turn-helix domain-containing protein [Nocardiopsis endophytica]MDA2809783.1 helix-turn-helix domain containing protein [Nocardiopsis endophytica]
MSSFPETPRLRSVRIASSEYAIAAKRLRLAAIAAHLQGEPVEVIAEAAGVTRQTVHTWASPGELPVQRPKAHVNDPVLVLHRLDGEGRVVWDGREGVVDGVGTRGRVTVVVPGDPVGVLAESHARVGDHTGMGPRPKAGDIVVCEGALGLVVQDGGLGGRIRVRSGKRTRLCGRWAIVVTKGVGSSRNSRWV